MYHRALRFESGFFVLLVCMLLYPLVSEAEDTANIADVFPEGRHRLDLGFSRYDGFDGEYNIWLPGSTYSYSRNLRFQAITSIIDVSIPQSDLLGLESRVDETGLGDSLVGVQYDPGGNLTAGPWIPDGIGLYANLIVPTGDKSKGLSLDAYVGQIGAGWLVDLPYNFWLVPSTWYTASFNHGENAPSSRAGAVGLGMYWLFPFAAWLGIEPYLGWDFDNDQDIDSVRLVAGKTFRNGVSIDLQWGTEDRTEDIATGDDDVLIINLSWQFGAPP